MTPGCILFERSGAAREERMIEMAEEGNIIAAKEDGLFASVEAVDISGKADKLANPEDGEAVIKAGQILVDDGAGNLSASGKTIAELTNDISEWS